MWRNDGETVFMSENFKMTTLALSSRDEKRLVPHDPIAEDEADIADILSGYLRRSGLRCDCGGWPTSARPACNAKTGTGIAGHSNAATQWLAGLSELRNRGNTPVIMLSGY